MDPREIRRPQPPTGPPAPPAPELLRVRTSDAAPNRMRIRVSKHHKKHERRDDLDDLLRRAGDHQDTALAF